MFMYLYSLFMYVNIVYVYVSLLIAVYSSEITTFVNFLNYFFNGHSNVCQLIVKRYHYRIWEIVRHRVCGQKNSHLMCHDFL